MTVAELMRVLAEQPDLNANIECRIGYTFYEKDPKVRAQLDRALAPQSDLTRDRNGRVIMSLIQLERGIALPLEVS